MTAGCCSVNPFAPVPPTPAHRCSDCSPSDLPGTSNDDYAATWKALPDHTDAPAVDDDAAFGIDPTVNPMAGGTQVATNYDGISTGTAAQLHQMDKAGYGDSTARPAQAAIQKGDSRIDDQIMVKKAADRQKQKAFMLDDIKRANPKGTPKAWDDRAEEKLKAAGW